MKKILAVVLALVLCLALCAVGSAEGKYKIGILAPAVTHGWVAGVAYNAEQDCLALAAAGTSGVQAPTPPATRRK